MADYTINISVNDDDAGRKLDDIDKKVSKVAKTHKIDFKFPDLDQAKRDLQEVGKYAGVAVNAFKQFTPVGKQFAELEDNIKVVGNGLSNVGRTLGGMSVYLNPIRGMSDGFTAVASSVDGLISNTARLGFAIFGVTQSVNVLKAAFGQMFDDTVGREVRFREQLLQTTTTLAGTNRVFLQGFEVEDPLQKLEVLEKSVSGSIERIRERSLEIAGTTSEAVISTFNVVASQIGSFGGTLRQAEDLAVKFSGALGTLGMSNPMYARQEIGSIMMGYVDNNSVLAKTLGITNPDIQKAKQTGSLVEYLGKKLEVFEAGQKKAAKGFAGVTSNIQELQEELKRSFGASLLDPILSRISDFYDKVSGKDVITKLKQTSSSFGQLVGSSLNSAYGVVAGSSVFQNVDTKSITAAADKIQAVFVKVSDFIQSLLARIAPTIQRIVDASVVSVARLGKAFAEMAGTLARVKLDQIVVRLQTLSALTPGIVAAANAYAEYLKTIEKIANTPIGRYVNEVREMNKILGEFGVKGIISNIIAVGELKRELPIIASQIAAIGQTVGNVVQQIFTFIANIYAKIVGATLQVTSTLSNAFITAFATVSGWVSKLAAQFSKFFATLSIAARLLGGDVAMLSAPLQKLSVEIGKLSTTLDVAEKNATDFGVKMRAAMASASAATAQASNSMTLLGTNLKNGIAKGAQAAGTAILGMVGGVLRAAASMAIWTIGISIVADAIRRLTEAWDKYSQNQRYKQSTDLLTNGLTDQARAAREVGRELDAVTRKRLEAALAEQSARKAILVDEIIRFEDILKKEQRLADALAKAGTKSRVPERQTRELEPRIAKLKAELKQIEDRISKATGKSPEGEDPQLRQQENRQAIEDLANFEKSARRSIEDEVYNYRRQIQDKEIQLWRDQGDLRIQQIDQSNRKLIEGVDSEARASLEALNNWIITKERGELDIEAQKKEAQLAAADLERAIGRFRMNLEQQVAEIRKRIGQYEIDVLDKRLQAEQMIANIRNGSVVWEAAGGSGDGRAFTGDTGNSSGPHADIRGENREKVVEETLQAILQWQKDNVEYIQLSNANIDVKNMTDSTQLRAAINREIDAHAHRVSRGTYAADIAVPVGSRVPVPLGTVQFDTGGGGYYGTNPNTGNRWLHLKQGSQGGASSAAGGAPTGASTLLNENAARWAQATAQFEGGKGYNTMYGGGTFNNTQPHPQSGSLGNLTPYGRYQFQGPTWTDAHGGRNLPMTSENQDRAFLWATRRRGVNVSTDPPTPENLRKLKNEFSSFPDGKEKRGTVAEFQQAFRAPLSGAPGGTAPGATPGSASLASVGGAPTKPNVTLNLDTSELDQAADVLKRLAEDRVKIREEFNQLTDASNFDAFVKSLDSTSVELENTTKQIGNAEIELKALSKATEGSIYDPRVLDVNVKYQQALAQAERLKTVRLDELSKKQGISDADRAKAAEAIENSHKKTLDDLQKIQTNLLSIVNLEKQRERITKLNQDRTELELAFSREKLQLQSQAREVLFDPEDPLRSRTEQAEYRIAEKQLELTNNGKEPMSDALQKSFEAYAKRERELAPERAKLDKAISHNRSLRELENKLLERRLETTRSEIGARTEAAKEALDPSNFQGRRRLDAERSIYEEYLNLSRGGTQALSDTQSKKLQELAEQALSSADALAVLDKQLADFASKLLLARDAAQTLVSGYKQTITDIIAGGDIGESISKMTQNIADSFTAKLLDYAFRPVEQQLEAVFRKIFGADSAEEKNTTALELLTGALEKNTLALGGAIPGPPSGGAIPDPQSGAAIPDPPSAIPPEAAAAAEAAAKTGEQVKQAASALPAAAEASLSSLQKYSTGLASVGAIALGVVGGIQNIKEGGTYGVLSGLSSIFGSIAGAASMFIPGGVFGGPRARGGPVSARVPYLVGEMGPELFVPQGNGDVLPTSATRALLNQRGAGSTTGASPEGGTNQAERTLSEARSTLRATQLITRERESERELLASIKAPAGALDVKYQSEVINNVEYVTASQFRQGMSSAAERGRALTLQALTNSVQTRKKVGL